MIRIHAVAEEIKPKARSPLTGLEAVPLHSIRCNDLIEEYQDSLGVDIQRLISRNLTIHLWECPLSGFRFYSPDNIVGDQVFYENLSACPWYYAKDKWEFHEALQFLPPGGHALEIGCGSGNFLNCCCKTNAGSVIRGIELNPMAAEEAKKLGFDVRVEQVDSHATMHAGIYDVVFAFQVLEHIPDPLPFLKACITLLRKGGLLVVAVPDNPRENTPSLFNSYQEPLNMPPHHQGLWDARSLAYLCKIFPLTIVHMKKETCWKASQLDPYLRHIRGDLKKKWGALGGRLVYSINQKYLRSTLQMLAPYLPAHTILTAFRNDNEDPVWGGQE